MTLHARPRLGSATTSTVGSVGKPALCHLSHQLMRALPSENGAALKKRKVKMPDKLENGEGHTMNRSKTKKHRAKLDNQKRQVKFKLKKKTEKDKKKNLVVKKK